MNKNKIILCSIGGVAAVAALVLGYLIYSAWEEKNESEESLESMEANVTRISKAKIAPSQASVDAISENKKTLEIWFTRALDVAARGDRSYPTLTVAEFCNTLRDEVAAARALPGGTNGKISGEDFSFGFRDIIDEGKLPKPDELAVLQRQWGDIRLFVETLSAAGAIQLTSVEKDAKMLASEPAPAPAAQRGRNPRQQQAKEEKPLADAQSYTIVFQARPLALVKTVNEFARSERFIVVDSLSFERATDALGNVLGGKDKEEARPSRGRRRGRGRAAAEEEAQEGGEEEVRRKGLVVDPISDTPFTVTMKLTTYDFGTKASGEATDDAAKAGEEE